MDIDNKLIKDCWRGDLSAAKECVEQGADIHVRNDWPLRLSATKGHLDVVKHLIKQGANIHAWNDEALRNAAFNRHLQVANALRKAAGDKYKCHNCIIKSTCLEICEDFRRRATK